MTHCTYYFSFLLYYQLPEVGPDQNGGIRLQIKTVVVKEVTIVAWVPEISAAELVVSIFLSSNDRPQATKKWRH